MNGFVNVSGMSAMDIKRMNQIDDAGDAWDNPYAYRNLSRRNPYAYRKPVLREPKVETSYKADDVWAAAWQAYVQNGNQYIKAFAPGIEAHKTNRMLVEELLADPTQITQESRDASDAMRRYFMGLTFKMIEGKKLSPFLQSAYDAACKSEINNRLEFAIIISLPATYEKSTKRDDVDRRINFARGGYLGDLGEKVSTEIEVLKCVWSQNWNTFYVTGLTGDDKVVFFAYKRQLNIGARATIQGTVKAFRDNSTQLNRVKEI